MDNVGASLHKQRQIVSAIVLAGGSSQRMGPGIDKLMCRVANRPLLAHCMLAFERCPEVQEIVLVARKDRQAGYQTLAVEQKISKLKSVVSGGEERQDSVWSGLQALSPDSELVLIHDGARALVTTDIITRCISAGRKSGAAIPASRVKDTIKRASPTPNKHGPRVETTLDRSILWSAQTPQTFRTDLIRQAYEPLIREQIIVTDDAAAVERIGYTVSLVECDSLNLKITTPEDLLLAEVLLSKRA